MHVEQVNRKIMQCLSNYPKSAVKSDAADSEFMYSEHIYETAKIMLVPWSLGKIAYLVKSISPCVLLLCIMHLPVFFIVK